MEEVERRLLWYTDAGKAAALEHKGWKTDGKHWGRDDQEMTWTLADAAREQLFVDHASHQMEFEHSLPTKDQTIATAFDALRLIELRATYRGSPDTRYFKASRSIMCQYDPEQGGKLDLLDLTLALIEVGGHLLCAAHPVQARQFVEHMLSYYRSQLEDHEGE